MNPLINHPILSGLPYKDLKNPSVECIKYYLAKKRKLWNRMKWGSFICIFVSIAISIIENTLTGMSLSVIAVYQFARSIDAENKYNMTDDEIIKAIESVHHPIKVTSDNNPDSYKWIGQADKHWG